MHYIILIEYRTEIAKKSIFFILKILWQILKRRTKQLISNLFFLKSGVLYKFGTFVLSFPLTFRQFLFFLQIPKS